MEVSIKQCLQQQEPVPEESVVLNGDQQVALDAMMSGGNVFLTVLDELKDLYGQGRINKYDLPVLRPYIQNMASGLGVKETEIETISRLLEKYRI